MTVNKQEDTIVRLLKQSRYLCHIESQKIRQLADNSLLKKLPGGRVILKQNEVNNCVYIIVSGSVSVHIDREHIYNLSRTGDILGEMSVITGGPSNATVMSESDVDLIEIPAGTLKQIHGTKTHDLHSALYQWFSNILTDKLYKTSQKAKQFERINRHLQRDLAEAKSTQDRIFSSQTHAIPNFPLTLKCEFSNILGGDLYAVFPVDQRRYGILIGDVSGHGTGACLISMMILNLFMAFATGSKSPGAVVAEVNRLSQQFMHQGKFVTLFYGVYDPDSLRLLYTNAGHHPALVLRKNNIIMLPATGGIPIGVLDDSNTIYREDIFYLEKGDRLFLCTDAVFEDRPDQSGVFQGLTGLAEYLNTAWTKTSPALVKALYDLRVDASQGVLPDDFTLMVFDQQ
ncbi:MAG: SpoIIE family protein phosphatase [Desulfobacterales bacterium]|nr:SpoIIE family protein phosphatase [Desulfobacterales bacterium]